MSKKLTRDDYTVGWICPLEVEQIAALEMLDEEHESLSQDSRDHNVYNLGSIAGHNVVITGLYQPGNNPAATTVAQMRMAFPNLRFGLLVGIGGGVPVKTDNGMIRLGDVVVSKPAGEHSGAVQYDHGRAKAGQFERTGALAPPPAVLLNAAQDLAAKRARLRKDPIEDNIKKVDVSIRGLRMYKHPGVAQDHLYQPDYIHRKPGVPCDECECDPSQRVQRPTDDEDDDPYIVVHRGTIASGELVVKDSILRDQLAEQYGLLCFETEAAGALADFPCIVIRGISDYCDSHKNDQWHGYAAVAAAAYARQLFFHMPINEVKRYISETAEEGIRYLKDRQYNQDRQKILDWLTITDYSSQQSDLISRRQKGTGQWLLDSVEFQGWVHQSKETLFCPGIPGAGKTIITSIVVEYLQINQENSSIAYLYCNFRQQDEQTLETLLKSILKQLARSHPNMLKSVNKLYKRHEENQSQPSLQEISEVLQTIISLRSRTFIVVDALDECQNYNGCRDKLLSQIFELQTKTGLNFFATSRHQHVESQFSRYISLEIRAIEEDIKSYLIEQILLWEKAHHVTLDNDLRDRIKTEITKEAEGMFLLAYLNMNTIQNQKTKRDIKNALKNLAKGKKELDKAYQQTMERIQNQDEGSKELAEQTLEWIIHAKRPLSTTELLHALAVRPHDTKLDEDGLPSVESLLSVCAGLVRLDEKSKIFDLVHNTTREFFESTKATRFAGAEMNLTETCATYLSFDTFESGRCQTDDEFEQRLRSNPLYDYAANNWGKHAREASTLCPQVIGFLESELKTEAASQALLAKRSWQSQWIPRQMTRLHLAAYFGVYEAVNTLIRRGQSLDLLDSYSKTPLSWAAEEGHEAVVKLLLEKGAKLEAKDIDNRTPLLYAAEDGHEAVVRLLLDKGAELEAKDINGRTPLIYAAEDGHEAVVRLLLDKCDELEAKDIDGRTPLIYAIEYGQETVAKLLLEKGAELEAKDIDNRTPLIYAIEYEQEAVAKLLLDKGAELEAKDIYSRTPLLYAAVYEQEAVAKLLLEKGAELEAKDIDGKTPLIYAAQYGYEAVVKLLLEKGADLEAKDIDSKTPLMYAIEYRQVAVVKLLLDKGAGLEAKDIKDRNATVIRYREGT